MRTCVDKFSDTPFTRHVAFKYHKVFGRYGKVIIKVTNKVYPAVPNREILYVERQGRIISDHTALISPS